MSSCDIAALTAERDELRKRLDDAKPATPAPGEWVEWLGGECPIADGVQIAARLRDGRRLLSRYAASLIWSDRSRPHDIVAYCILP